MNDVETAWLAGIFEGEGSAHLLQGKYPRVQVHMTDHDVVAKCHRIAGVGNVYDHKRTELANRKPSWVWVVSRSREAAELMRVLYPHLGERRRAKIDAVLAAYDAHASSDQARPKFH